MWTVGVFHRLIMPFQLQSPELLSRFLFVFQLIGDTFLKVRDLSSLVKTYIALPEKEEDGTNEEQFEAQARTLLFLHQSLSEVTNFNDRFHAFQEFSLDFNFPAGTVLISSLEICRQCGKKLTLQPKRHPIVVYHLTRGTFLGSRITKVCRACKIYEHYGYWTQNGKHIFNEEAWQVEFIMTSEDTVFHTMLFKQYSTLLVLGALPFLTYAASYNQTHGYASSKINKINTKTTPRKKR